MDSDKQDSPQDPGKGVLRKLPRAGARVVSNITGKPSSTGGGGAGLFRPRSIKTTGQKSYPRPEADTGSKDAATADLGKKTASIPVPKTTSDLDNILQEITPRRPEAKDASHLERPVPPPPRNTGLASRQIKPPPVKPKKVTPHQGLINQSTPKPSGYSTNRAASPKAPDVGLKSAPRQEMREDNLRRKAQPYEWGRTDKFANDQKKFLERVFKQFSDYVTTKLATLLQSRVELEYQGAKLRPYGDFLQDLYEPISIVLMRIDPEYKGLLVLDFPLSFALIDRCLGGKGQPLEEVRYFTEIEVAVLERVVQRIIDCYQEAWSEVKETKPQYLEMQFNPQTVHIMNPSDIIVTVPFDFKMGQIHCPVHVVLPFEYLKSVLPKANFEEYMLTRSSSAQVSPSVAPLFAKNLEQARVPVSVELGSTELLFSELAVLEVGDFIKLDQEITKPLRVKVNDRCKFQGRPGIKDGKISVQLTRVLQEGDEDYDV